MAGVKPLDRAFKVDRAINNAAKSFVIIRFVDQGHKDCEKIDQWIARYSKTLSFFSEIYKVEKKDVPEHVARYGLSDSDTILYFYKGSAIHRLSETDIEEAMKKSDFFDTTYDIMRKALQPGSR